MMNGAGKIAPGGFHPWLTTAAIPAIGKKNSPITMIRIETALTASRMTNRRPYLWPPVLKMEIPAMRFPSVLPQNS